MAWRASATDIPRAARAATASASTPAPAVASDAPASPAGSLPRSSRMTRWAMRRPTPWARLNAAISSAATACRNPVSPSSESMDSAERGPTPETPVNAPNSSTDPASGNPYSVGCSFCIRSTVCSRTHSPMPPSPATADAGTNTCRVTPPTRTLTQSAPTASSAPCTPTSTGQRSWPGAISRASRWSVRLSCKWQRPTARASAASGSGVWGSPRMDAAISCTCALVAAP